MTNLSILKPGPLWEQIQAEEQINSLSFKQPFGAAMLFEKYETRKRRTNYRGLVLICTSKIPYLPDEVKKISGPWLYGNMMRAMKNDTGIVELNGHAIAIGELVDCRLMTRKDERKAFVRYKIGLYVHIYKNVRSIQPFEWNGTQGFRYLKEEEKKKIILL